MFYFWILLSSSASGDSSASYEAFRNALRNHIVTSSPGGELLVVGGAVRTLFSLTKVYHNRAFEPLWVDAEGLNEKGAELLEALAAAHNHGISPARYRLATLRILADNNVAALRPKQQVDLELLLTDGFLLHAADLAAGRVDPAELDPLWQAYHRIHDLPALIEKAVTEGPRTALEDLTPPHPEYTALQAELHHVLNEPAVDWSPVPPGEKMTLNSRGERVTYLEQALLALGYLNTIANDDYDVATYNAVLAFQRDNGLQTDGIAGRSTLDALNNTHPIHRWRKLALNLERWRWLPNDLGVRHLRVNVAGFDLRLINNGETELTMSVIVGREARRSPVMSAPMTYLVLNPSWNVPHKIAVQDKLPLLKKDPSVLSRQGYEVYRGWGPDASPIDPAIIDWSTLSPEQFPYRLRQQPGPENALGRIKFMFPNKFDVYLHDTPTKSLFARTERAFSSGCIRVEQPVALALALLKDDPNWTQDSLEAAFSRGREQVVHLKQPVPVHLLYWTAWVETNGTARFLRDIYARDERLDSALRLADGG